MASMIGRVALVTGAASGIGRATAIGLAREGAAVVLLARNAERGSQAAIRAASRRFIANNDRLDVLVNAAGVFVKEKTLTADGIELTFATNYLSYFLLTHELLAVLWLATAPETGTITGKMFAKRKEIRTPGQGSDPAARKRLWEESEKLTHLA